MLSVEELGKLKESGYYPDLIDRLLATIGERESLKIRLEFLKGEMHRMRTELMACNMAADGSSDTDRTPSIAVAERITKLEAELEKLKSDVSSTGPRVKPIARLLKYSGPMEMEPKIKVIARTFEEFPIAMESYWTSIEPLYQSPWPDAIMDVHRATSGDVIPRCKDYQTVGDLLSDIMGDRDICQIALYRVDKEKP